MTEYIQFSLIGDYGEKVKFREIKELEEYMYQKGYELFFKKKETHWAIYFEKIKLMGVKKK